MLIALASDHAGFKLKEKIKRHLSDKGHEVKDLGPSSVDRCDYPDYGFAAAKAVAGGEASFGVLVCGSGIGMCMVANRVKGVRAAVLRDRFDAEMSRRHNDANVACFGGRVTAVAEAELALGVFLGTDFEGGRHERRVDLLAELDAEGR